MTDTKHTADDTWIREMKEPEKQTWDGIFGRLDDIVKEAVGQEKFDKMEKHPPRWRKYDEPTPTN